MSRADRLPPPNAAIAPLRAALAAPLTREGDSFLAWERSDRLESGGSATASTTPLTDHLRDAIRLNRARRARYRHRGGWRAGLLSRALVASERMLLFPARWLDAQAARHPVPILSAELADMADAPCADGPLARRAATGEAAPPLQVHVRRARQSLRAGDLAAAARASARLVHALRQRERADGRHRALAVHVAESAGWMAARGAEYARQTDGATIALSVRLVRGHLVLLPAARLLDRLAAPVHARGAGLFVNDLPPIPFPADD